MSFVAKRHFFYFIEVCEHGLCKKKKHTHPVQNLEVRHDFACVLAGFSTHLFTGLFAYLGSLLIGCLLASLPAYMAWPTRLGLATLAWLTDLVRLELGSIGFLDLLDMPGLLDCLGFWRNRLQHYNGAVFF